MFWVAQLVRGLARKAKPRVQVLVQDKIFVFQFYIYLGGPVVIILASGSEVCGFDPGQGRWIFQSVKILSIDFLRMGSKALGPVS